MMFKSHYMFFSCASLMMSPMEATFYFIMGVSTVNEIITIVQLIYNY